MKGTKTVLTELVLQLQDEIGELRKHEHNPEWQPSSDRLDRISLSAIVDDLEDIAKTLESEIKTI